MGIKIVAKEQATLPEGVYDAIVAGVEQRSGKFGPVLAISFLAITDDEEVLVNGLFASQLTPMSKLGQVFAALGIPVVPGTEYDLDMILNKPCTIWVSHTTTPQGAVFANVSKVTQARKEFMETLLSRRKSVPVQPQPQVKTLTAEPNTSKAPLNIPTQIPTVDKIEW